MLAKRRRLEQSCTWSPARLADHQSVQTSAIRAFAIERSPFYARFHRGLDNRPLHELPILTKATLMEHFDDVVTDRTVRLADLEQFLTGATADDRFQSRYVVLATSGSTGLRGVFLFDQDEWVECLASISRPMTWAGVRPRLFPRIRSTMLASTSPWHYSSQVGRSLTTVLLPTLRLDAGEPVERMVERLNAWQPDVLVAYPSVLRLLAAEQSAGRLAIAPESCATSAEVLTEETRRRVREAFGVRVFETYGATEYAPIAAECSQGNRHLFEDGAVIEIVDDHGRPVPPGVSGDRVLLTIFGRRTQPLIRYEISDMVRLSDRMCECGRPFRCIEAIEGRQEDVLVVEAAVASARTIEIHPNVFHHVLETAPASAWQVVQVEDGLLVNLVGLRDSASELPRIEGAIRDAVAALGARVPSVRAVLVNELRRGRTSKAPLIMARERPIVPVASVAPGTAGRSIVGR